MGASESKLVFKQGIFRLSEEQAIPANDQYWTGVCLTITDILTVHADLEQFWLLPESADDVFSLFSAADVRRTRDSSLQNFETLILAVTSRLSFLRHHPAFPDPELAPERDALNCIRVLTRILPFVYEADHLSEWETQFFWTVRRRRVRKPQAAGEVLFDETQEDDSPPFTEDGHEYEDAKPLAEELIDNLLDLLFFTGFTIPKIPGASSKVTHAIWQSGVGCKTSIATSKELESTRCEVLRLLLTMLSKSMYLSPTILPAQGVGAITYITTNTDKQVVLSVLCSLLNTVIKHNSASWRLPYDHVVWKDSRQSLVVYSMHVLLVLLLYPVPEDGRAPPPKNFYRHFLGRLHRPEDFQFLADGMTRVLSQPMQATTSFLPGSQKSVHWAPEMIMLFWEVLQCNKRFRSFIIDSNRAHDFVVLVLFYAIEYKTDPTRQGIVRMCVFVLQTMSVEPAFGKNLNKKFEAQDTLPSAIRISNFRGTYADFLIISINTLLTTSKGKLDAIYPALLAIINNIAAYVQNISMVTCSKLMQLFTTMSSPSFLLANETNHNLLQSLLESINTMIEHQYQSNANLVYAVLRSRRRIDTLRAFTLDGGQQALERAAQRRKESLDTPRSPDSLSNSRRTSTADLMSPLSHTADESNTNDDDGTFTIGDYDSDDEAAQHTPSQSSASARDSRAPSIASSSAEDSLPSQVRGMSEKARGKMPISAQSFSRQNSTLALSNQNTYNSNQYSSGFSASPEWLASWLPDLPLHTLLTLIKALASKLPPSTSSSSTATTTSPSPDLAAFLTTLPTSTTHSLIAPLLSSPSTIRVHLFEWSTLSLGWYMSVLWSLIFTAEMYIAPTSSTTTSTITNTVTGGAAGAGSVGPIGVWNGTMVRLFQVSTEGKREGPSLSKPRGAVDAVGTRLVAGVQGLGLGGLVSRVVGGGAGGTGATTTTTTAGGGGGLSSHQQQGHGGAHSTMSTREI